MMAQGEKTNCCGLNQNAAQMHLHQLHEEFVVFYFFIKFCMIIAPKKIIKYNILILCTISK